jgi:hypothetical protein
MPGVIPPPTNESAQNGPGEFPVDALPPILRDMVNGIVEVSRVPIDMAGPCVLATASACLGQGIELRSAPGMRCAGNLYIMLVKPSGAGGSTAYRFATAPLRRYQTEALRNFDENTQPQLERQKATLRADLEKTLSDRKSAKKNDDEVGAVRAEKELDQLHIQLAEVEAKLVPPYIWVTDCTQERLASLMAARGDTLAHFDPDGADSVAGILGMRYGKGDHTGDSLHLKSYSREAVSISRQGSGKGGATNTFISSPCLTTFWVVTPDIAKKLFTSERMLRGGLIARFNIVYSSARPQPWAMELQEISTELAARYEKAAFSLLDNYRNRALGELKPIDMDSGAWNLFADHYSSYCDRFDPDFSAFEARHTENAMRIALVLHAWKHIDFLPGENVSVAGHTIPLNEETAANALKLSDWFVAHQRELLAPQHEAIKTSKFDKIHSICSRHSKWVISSRDLITHKLAANAQVAEGMLAEWMTEGRIVREDEDIPNKGGRPRGSRYRVLKSKGGSYANFC